KGDFLSFYESEIATRQLFNYPPFTQMVKVSFSGTQEALVLKVAEELRLKLRQKLPPSFDTHPTIPCGYAKIKNRYRFQFLVRGQSTYPISRALEVLLQTVRLPKEIRISIDVNPTSTYF